MINDGSWWVVFVHGSKHGPSLSPKKSKTNTMNMVSCVVSMPLVFSVRGSFIGTPKISISNISFSYKLEWTIYLVIFVTINNHNHGWLTESLRYSSEFHPGYGPDVPVPHLPRARSDPWASDRHPLAPKHAGCSHVSWEIQGLLGWICQQAFRSPTMANPKVVLPLKGIIPWVVGAPPGYAYTSVMNQTKRIGKSSFIHHSERW